MGVEEGGVQTTVALETALGILIFSLSSESDTSDLSFNKVVQRHPSKFALPPFNTSSEPLTCSKLH